MAELRKINDLITKCEKEKKKSIKLSIMQKGYNIMEKLIKNKQFNLVKALRATEQEISESDESLAVAQKYTAESQRTVYQLLDQTKNIISSSITSDPFVQNSLLKVILNLSVTAKNENFNLFQETEGTNILEVLCKIHSDKNSFLVKNISKGKINLEVFFFLLLVLVSLPSVKSLEMPGFYAQHMDLNIIALQFISHLILLKSELTPEAKILHFPLVKEIMKLPSSLFYSRIFSILKLLSTEPPNPPTLYLLKKNLISLHDFQVKLFSFFFLNLYQTTLMDKNISTKLKIRLLNNLPEKVFPKVSDPLFFSDILSKVCNSYFENRDKVNVALPILSLESLLILISRYNLNFENYYEKLYHFLQVSFGSLSADTQQMFKFFKVLDLTLSSKTVDEKILASFLKALCLRCISASIPFILLSLVIIHNTIILHPSLMKLIQKEEIEIADTTGVDNFDRQRAKVQEIKNRSKKLAESISYDKKKTEAETQSKEVHEVDPFLVFSKQPDPLKTNAINSSLVELRLLREHYAASVRTVVESLIFESFGQTRKEKPGLVPISRFEDVSYESLFKAACSGRRKTKNVQESFPFSLAKKPRFMV
eukprot:snap_masked-scaffold_34-processed-gene-3.30-mRNA-1 protein AED:1.00 eAED:1.00 QI:0/-1/0/0/-1/1/1/0/594